MSRSHLWVSTGIIALVIIFAFVLSVPHTRDIFLKQAPVVATSTPVVSIHDVYKKGTHTITGALTVADACIPVTSSAALVGDASSSESVLITLSYQDDTEVCLQVPTSVSFQLTIAAPAGVPIQASVNGETASTTHS